MLRAADSGSKKSQNLSPLQTILSTLTNHSLEQKISVVTPYSEVGRSEDQFCVCIAKMAVSASAHVIEKITGHQQRLGLKHKPAEWGYSAAGSSSLSKIC